MSLAAARAGSPRWLRIVSTFSAPASRVVSWPAGMTYVMGPSSRRLARRPGDQPRP